MNRYEIYYTAIIEAIKYIMDNNIVHRDLKPHNILINKDTKEIKICDFGFENSKIPY